MKKAKFNIEISTKGEVSMRIEGKRISLLEMISFAAYKDENIMELLMDSLLAAVAIHMKKEHDIDLIDYIEAKMSEQLQQYKKKERVVN